MLQHYKTLQTLPTAQPFLEEERKIFEELEIMGEKLSIQNFSLDSQLKSFVPRLQKAVAEKQAELSQKQAIFSVRSEQENKLKKHFNIIICFNTETVNFNEIYIDIKNAFYDLNMYKEKGNV